MNRLLIPFARSLRQGPVFASVLLDDMLRQAGLTWQGKTEDVLIQLWQQAGSAQFGYVQGSLQLFKRMDEVD